MKKLAVLIGLSLAGCTTEIYPDQTQNCFDFCANNPAGLDRIKITITDSGDWYECVCRDGTVKEQSLNSRWKRNR